MREMKESGIKWVGEIPNNWEVKLVGRTFKEAYCPNTDLSEENALQFKMGEIVSKKEGNSKYNPESLIGYNIVEPNTIMINGLNLSFDFISQRVAIVKKKGVITSTYLAIFPNKEVMSGYALFLLKSYDGCKALHAMGRGLRATLNFNIFKTEKIILPPLSEQKAIAEFLDKKCGEIEELVGIEEHIIAELQAYKQAIITEAVTNGIDVNEKRNNQSFTTISNICYLSDGIKIEGRRLINLDVQYLRGKSKGTIISSGKYIPAYSLLILVDGENSGEVFTANIEGYQGSTFKKLTINKNWYEKYVIYIINSLRVKLKENKVGSAIPHLDKKLFNKTKVNIIPLPEQQAIAEYLDKRCEEIDSLIIVKQQKIAELKEYKKSVIYEYVTGKKEII